MCQNGPDSRGYGQAPLVGIANSFTEVTPGHLHLRTLADIGKQGIREMGAVPMEFGTGAPCDAYGNANPGYRYILPMRENIADTVELMAKAHHFDGLLLLSGCDKINPAMLMAAARVNRRSVHGRWLGQACALTWAWARRLLCKCCLKRGVWRFSQRHHVRQFASIGYGEQRARRWSSIHRGIKPSDI
jgi:hypothetical protein